MKITIYGWSTRGSGAWHAALPSARRECQADREKVSGLRL